MLGGWSDVFVPPGSGALALLMSSGLEILGGLCVVFGVGRRGVCVGLVPVCLQLGNIGSSTPSVRLEPEAACLPVCAA